MAFYPIVVNFEMPFLTTLCIDILQRRLHVVFGIMKGMRNLEWAWPSINSVRYYIQLSQILKENACIYMSRIKHFYAQIIEIGFWTSCNHKSKSVKCWLTQFKRQIIQSRTASDQRRKQNFKRDDDLDIIKTNV